MINCLTLKCSLTTGKEELNLFTKFADNVPIDFHLWAFFVSRTSPTKRDPMKMSFQYFAMDLAPIQ